MVGLVWNGYGISAVITKESIMTNQDRTKSSPTGKPQQSQQQRQQEPQRDPSRSSSEARDSERR